MFFLAFIANDGLKYQYWFRYDNERILEEDLIFFKKLQGRFSTHSSLLFSRSSTDGVKFGPSFKGPRSQVRKTIELRPKHFCFPQPQLPVLSSFGRHFHSSKVA